MGQLTVNHKDIDRAGGNSRNTDEVDVVLGEGHDGGVVAAVRGRLYVLPGDRVRLCSGLFTQVERVHFTMRNCVKYVRVVIEDCFEVGRVKIASGDLLSGPRLLSSVVNVDV